MALSPTTTTKQKNKDHVRKIKHGSPKLQEVLREKCRQRMRERRDQLFNRHRFGSELDSRHMQDTLTEIIRQEFKNLATTDWKDNIFDEIDEPLSLEEAIELENEIIGEQEQWIIQEYERMTGEDIAFLVMYADNEGKEVFCPICQKVVLIEESNCILCTACGLKLTGHTMQEIDNLINESVRAHSCNCTKVPTFTVIPDNTNLNLYIICQDCSTLALIC